MNELNNKTKKINNQVVNIKNHIDRLLNKLPQTLDESAKNYGALIRRRIIKSATDLLLALLIYGSSKMSLRVLASSTALMGIADISDRAWQKKLIKCEAWLSYLSSETIFKLSDKSKLVYGGRTVKLVDGSTIQQEGKSQKGGGTVRVHMCYNLTEGRMDCVLVTDKHTAESVSVFSIESEIIYIADAGYGSGKNLAHIVSHGADAIFRATPNHLNLALDENGKAKIDMAKALETRENLLDFTCYVHTENKKYVPARIIASRLPEDKAMLAKERKIRSAKKRQTKNIRPQTLVYAGWMILITTLGSEYSAESALKMYRSRWQIELLFKRIKQSFAVSKLPAASLQHSKVMVLLWLILWSLTEHQAVAMELFLLDREADMRLYSSWSMQNFLFQQLRAVINCIWALSFNAEDAALFIFKHLRNHRSSRENQYAQLRFDC